MKNLRFKTLYLLLALIFASVSIFAQKTNSSATEPTTIIPSYAHVCNGHHHHEETPETFPIPSDHGLKNAMIDPPTNIQVVNESPYHMTVSWTAPQGCNNCSYVVLFDNDGNSSNGYYHYVGAGTNTSRQYTQYSLNGNMTLNVGQNFNVYVQAYQGGYSDLSAPATTAFDWNQVGNSTNDITYTYEGWTTTEQNMLSTFIGKIKPIIHDIYGPPANPTAVKIVRLDGTQVYMPDVNEIRIGRERVIAQREFHLLVHEMLHSWRDNAGITATAYWNYNDLFSAYEEGFAQTGANDCMNEYISQYPNDYDLTGNPSQLNKTIIFGSSTEWDYDFRNKSALSTGAFYTFQYVLNRGLSFERYEMAAAALKKIQIEYPTFYKDFNVEYYARLDADNTLTVSKSLIEDIIATVAPTIEGKDAFDWIDQQAVLACEVTTGKKIFNKLYQTFGANTTQTENRYFFYETFDDAYHSNSPSGPDYYFLGGDFSDINNFVFNHLNGSSGTGTISNSQGTTLKTFTPTISTTPTDGYGYFTLLLYNNNSDNTAANTQYWGQSVNRGLYKIDMNFAGTTTTDYRIIGSDLNAGNGIFGGLLNADGGQLFIKHEDFPTEDSFPIENGAFYGTPQWIGVPNSLTGGYDSAPGQLTIRYVDNSGNEYITYKNIDIGNFRGLQTLLLDVNDMTPVADDMVIGEQGNVTISQANSNHWVTVNLNNTYTNPVVVMGPISFAGGHQSTMNVRNVTSTSFQCQVDEWDYLDGAHATETVGYMVVEAGTHTLSNGAIMTAGNFSLSNTAWQGLGYSAAGFTTPPIVMTQNCGSNGGHTNAATMRVRNITTGGFQVRLQEEENNDQVHSSGRVAFIAVEAGTSNGTEKFEVNKSADNVTHAWRVLNFSQSYANPVFLAKTQTTDGGDPLALRYRNLGSTSAQVKCEEEKSKNIEVAHTTEVVGWMVFDAPGDITAVDNANLVAGEETTETPQEATEDSKIDETIMLSVRNYPNPFSGYTTIEYTLNTDSAVTLTVSDLNGRQIAVLVDGKPQARGTHTATFDGSSYPAGMYYYTIRAGEYVGTQKMILAK